MPIDEILPRMSSADFIGELAQTKDGRILLRHAYQNKTPTSEVIASTRAAVAIVYDREGSFPLTVIARGVFRLLDIERTESKTISALRQAAKSLGIQGEMSGEVKPRVYYEVAELRSMISYMLRHRIQYTKRETKR